MDADGYPENTVRTCEGFWFASHRGYGILGHRSIKDTAVLGPRLLRLLSADLARLADDLEGSVADATVPVSGDSGRDPAGALVKAQARAEAAEAKLSLIAEFCRDESEFLNTGTAGVAIVRAVDILAIIGSEEREEAPYDRDFAGTVL